MQVRLVPMSKKDPDMEGKSIETIQNEYFETYLKNVDSDDYEGFKFKNAIKANSGDLFLFQLDGKVIASAILDDIIDYDIVRFDGYNGQYDFKTSTIRTFVPITSDEMKKYYNNFKGFNQSPQYLEINNYKDFIERTSIKSINDLSNISTVNVTSSIEEYNEVRVKSKEDWIKVLNNEESLNNDNVIEILKYIYLSNNHMCNCGQVADYLKTEPVAINGIIAGFGKRALELLKLPEIPGDNGQNRRWNIPFMTNSDFNKDGLFTWILRPELVTALEEKYKLKSEYDNNIDAGVKFVLDNFDKTIELLKDHPEYQKYKGRVISEYNRIKYIKYTGDMYEHFFKFKDGNHKYADDFKFLSDYGIITNEEMSDYLKKNYFYELKNTSGIDDLIIGNVYSNSEISNTFSVSNMGGMRRSLKTNSLVLISKHQDKHVGSVYEDEWTKDGILNYTGMGTIGDQSINFGQNKTLAIAKKEGIKVYLFESYKDNEYYYDGEVELAGAIFQADEKDINGNIRKVIKFPLRKINQEDDIVDEQVEKVSYDIVQISEKIESDEINGIILREGIPEIRKYNNIEERKKNNRTSKPDYIAEEIIKTKQGELNEKVIYEMELQKLMELEAEEEVRRMQEFFENRKDNEGYDILSFEVDEEGNLIEKYIEVKSTKGPESTPIDITSNEIEFAKQHLDNYFIYRIFNSNNKNRSCKILSGKNLFSKYSLIPTAYKIYSNSYDEKVKNDE